MIDTIIFDLGGTLIEYAGAFDAWPDLERPGFQAAYHYLAGQGAALPAFDQFTAAGLERLPGRWRQATAGVQNLRLVDLLAEVLAEHRVTGVQPEWVTAAADRYQAAVCAQAQPIPGAQETLARLQAQGYRLGLISNTMFTGAAHRADLERFGLAGYLETMLFSADANKWKPNPEPYWQVLAELGTRPETAVYIGDDPAHDVVGGRRAGLRTIHFRSSQRFRPPDGVLPDAQITNLGQLAAVLAEWGSG